VIREFLLALCPPGTHGFLNIRAFRAGRGGAVHNDLISAGNVDLIERAVNAAVADGLDAYVGVALRRDKTRSGLNGCVALPALFVDRDDPDRAPIDAFPLPPSFVVQSGKGWHAYWLLTEPISLAGDGASRAKGYLRALASAVGGDLKSAEPARILRVPGTKNFKYDPPRPVVAEIPTDLCRYTLDEITALLPPADATAPKAKLAAEIPDGARNDLLFREGCALRGRGYGEQEIAEALAGLNRARVAPPVSDDEIRAIAASATRYEASEWETYTRGPRKGEIIADSQTNIARALASFGVSLSFDQFTARALVAEQTSAGPLDDAIVDRLWLKIDAAFGFRPSREFFFVVVNDLARQRSFHPVRDYFGALVWDGTPRIDRWLPTYCGAPDTPYTRAVGALLLTAIVRRVRAPGAKYDEIVIWESPTQGMDKSSGWAALCPFDAWFSDDLPLGVGAKETIERTAGKILIEASDLHGYSDADVERLKAFLSRRVDGPVRLAYARTPVEVPRSFVLVGTTNRDEYLRDTTGNRRFWPVRVQRIDVAAIQRDRDQLWAEAAAREATGASIRLSPDLWGAAGIEQEQRREVDPWEELLDEAVVDGFDRDYVPVAELWGALDKAATYRKRNDAARLAQIMRAKGFTRKEKRRVEGQDGPVWVWIREGATVPDEIQGNEGRKPGRGGNDDLPF
jgi:hypothetical protein